MCCFTDLNIIKPAVISQSTKKLRLQLLKKFSFHLLLFLNIQTETKQTSLCSTGKGQLRFFFPVLDCRHVIYRNASASAFTPLDSEVYRSHSGALQVPGTPPITVSWMIRWDGHHFERQHATLPQHYIKPVTRLLFYTFKRLLHAWCSPDKHDTTVTVGQFRAMISNYAAFECTCVFNGVWFAVLCLIVFFFYHS